MSKAVLPRNAIVGILFGSEPYSKLSKIINDGSRFFKLANTLELLTFFKSSPFMVKAEPVKLPAFRWKIPFTTTSSTSVTSSSKTIWSGLSSVTFTSFVFIPTKENCKVISLLPGNVNWNFPSVSVTTPPVVPFIKTVTPGSGSLSLSVTFPSIFLPLSSSGAVFTLSLAITKKSSTSLQCKPLPFKASFKASTAFTFRKVTVTRFTVFNSVLLYTTT